MVPCGVEINLASAPKRREASNGRRNWRPSYQIRRGSSPLPRRRSLSGGSAGPYGGCDDQDFEDDRRRDLGARDGRGRRSADGSGVGRRLAAAAVAVAGTAAAGMAAAVGMAAAGTAAAGMAAAGRGRGVVAWGLLARRLLEQRLVGPGDRRGRDRRRGDRQLSLLGRRLWVWRRLLAGSADLRRLWQLSSASSP